MLQLKAETVSKGQHFNLPKAIQSSSESDLAFNISSYLSEIFEE